MERPTASDRLARRREIDRINQRPSNRHRPPTISHFTDEIMLRTIAVFLLCLTLGSSLARGEELIHWHTNLATARQVSQQYKVPMLVHFYGDQCLPCESLEKNVFTRPEVASTMQRYFVPVKINATTDRKTAAEFGVHSWPTDVFLGPDGKALSQGVCTQNPNAYLQNLQNIALMNRDRNAMLAGAAKPATPEPTGNVNPYGRTAANNLQQAAPGRDAAPNPYSNPATGASPYAAGAPVGGLTSANTQSTMPSPTWQGQSANGQAQNGLVSAGPVANSSSMTLPPPQPSYAQDNKQANIPPSAQWQTNPPVSSSPFSQNSAIVNSSPKLPLAPTLPSGPLPQNNSSMVQVAPTQNKTVDNPYFPSATPAANAPTSSVAGSVGNIAFPSSGSVAAEPSATEQRPAGHAVPSQLVSSTTSIVRADTNPASTQAAQTNAQTNVPALDGYCPVSLMHSQSWVRGLEKFAVRHRGKVYLLSSEQAAKEFMAAPDTFTPVLSGYDPLVFLREGRLVEGSIYDGVLRLDSLVFLFSNEENKEYFRTNYQRLVEELEVAVANAK